MKRVIITFEVPVYKDRSKNSKAFISSDIKTNQIDETTWRVRPCYSQLTGYIESICIMDLEGNTLEDVTAKYSKPNYDGTEYLDWIVQEVFRDNGVKW